MNRKRKLYDKSNSEWSSRGPKIKETQGRKPKTTQKMCKFVRPRQDEGQVPNVTWICGG